MQHATAFACLILAVPWSQAAGIAKIAVTDSHITPQPESGTAGILKVVAIEPYDSYQSSRNWSLGETNNGGVVDFNTSKITYKNYEILPEYFQREELLFNGQQRGISLTEQGFHTPSGASGPVR